MLPRSVLGCKTWSLHPTLLTYRTRCCLSTCRPHSIQAKGVPLPEVDEQLLPLQQQVRRCCAEACTGITQHAPAQCWLAEAAGSYISKHARQHGRAQQGMVCIP